MPLAIHFMDNITLFMTKKTPYAVWAWLIVEVRMVTYSYEFLCHLVSYRVVSLAINQFILYHVIMDKNNMCMQDYLI